jgi:hypothetical protein
MRRCEVHTKRLCLRCVLFTLGFPVEHFMWERIPPLAWIAGVIGIA